MSDKITYLPLSALRESPTNPRKHYNQARLQELADSVKAQGVMQPIVVRPIYPNNDAPTDARERYEVVCGHRRLRAATMAELDGMPCIIRELSDEDAAIIQLVENAQREDVTALEEAEGFRRLIDEHRVKVPQLIKQTGKSKSYVYARLKLLHLTPEVKAALEAGTIDAEVGVLISRLPQGVQAEALDEVVLTSDDGKPEGMSYRRAKDALAHYLVNLDEEADFELSADDLSQTAPACTKCQRRSGNNPDLQAELGDNICTGRECFRAKSAVFTQRRINAAKEAGQQVIEGDEARRVQYYPGSWMSGYRKLDDDAKLPNGATIKVRDLIEQCGAQAPVPALLSHPAEPGKLVEVISTEAIERMCKIAAGIDPDARPQLDLLPQDGRQSGAVGAGGGDDDDDAAPTADRWADHPPEARAVLAYDSWEKVRDAIVARVRTTARTTEDLRHILRRELELANEFPPAVVKAFDWAEALAEADDEQEFLAAKIDELGPDDLAAILVIIAIDNLTERYFSVEKEAAFAASRLALAATYGVDPLNPDAAVQAPAPSKKKGKKTAVQEPDEATEGDTRTSDLFERQGEAA